MEKSDKKILYLVIGIIAVIMLMNGEKKEQGYWVNTLDQCLHGEKWGRDDRITYYENQGGSYFVSPCYEITQEAVDCSDKLESENGNYVFFHADYGRVNIRDWEEESLSCLELYSTPNPSNGNNCNTDADTNCDNSVSDSELLSYASKWLSNQISDNELLEAASAWLN